MHNDSESLSDVDVIRRVIDGDVNAFEFLLKRYREHVLRIVSRHIPQHQVEETAQDVFVRVYQSLPTFGQKSGFKQWVSAIAVRTCHDFWRKHYRTREVPMSSLTEKHQEWLEKTVSDRSSESFFERGAQKEAGELLDWALDRLSPSDRMVLELIYLEGLSVKETAELLGWSTANVKIRSFRSRSKLKKLLSGLTEKERRET
jgi:RNA polymerase sigma-70 factor (ECF subfamily)